MATSLDALLAERIERVAPTAVDADVVARWAERFGDPTGASVDRDAVPPEMITTFLRSAEPPAPGESAATNVALHDRLKRELALPVGIAVGYELECHAPIRIGERMVSTERIAEIGDERDTRFGRGRDWVIEVASSIAEGARAGELVCVERWRMLGYDPARASESGSSGSEAASVPIASDGWTDTLTATRELIVGGATANRVWAGAHHTDGAAVAAGLPGIILDTSSWVALMARHARAGIGPDARLGSVALTMRRPVVVDDEVIFEASIIADAIDAADVRWVGVEVIARVAERMVASAVVRFAVASADGTALVNLTGDRWRP